MKKLFTVLLLLAATAALTAQNAKLPGNIMLKDLDGKTVTREGSGHVFEPVNCSFTITDTSEGAAGKVVSAPKFLGHMVQALQPRTRRHQRSV